MTAALDISVVVCAYTEQRWNDLVAALATLQQQTLALAELIVVIDHNPALFERARQEISGVILVENTSARAFRSTQ